MAPLGDHQVAPLNDHRVAPLGDHLQLIAQVENVVPLFIGCGIFVQ